MNLRNITERNELAADIARRVRMYSWQPLDAEVAAGLGEHGGRWRYNIGFGGWNCPTIELIWIPRPQRLELSFIMPSGEQRGRLLWTPDTTSAVE